MAVDEGDESVRALRWCLANFATRGDTILLLYARAPPPTYNVLDATGTYLCQNQIHVASALRESIPLPPARVFWRPELTREPVA